VREPQVRFEIANNPGGGGALVTVTLPAEHPAFDSNSFSFAEGAMSLFIAHE